MPVRVIFENLEGGLSFDEIEEQFGVDPAITEGLLHFVTLSLDKEPAY